MRARLAFVFILGWLLFAPQAVGADQLNTNESGEYAYIPEDASVAEASLSAEPAAASSVSTNVVELGGATRYDTVAKEALHAYGRSDVVVVASGAGWADSIAAAGLAGALDCPILLTGPTYVPSATVQALDVLKPSRIILLGSEDVANNDVYRALASRVSNIDRVYGADRFATQLAIYEYGKRFSLWTGDTAVVVSATGYADALSISPISFKLKAPVFFCDGSGGLPNAQKVTLCNSGKTQFLLTGSTVVTSSDTEQWLSQLGKTRRLGGSNRYLTSLEIAKYAIENLGFSWDGLAFASGQGPYDSLGGGVVQGKGNSVLLLADSVGGALTAQLAAPLGAKAPGTVKFFGSPAVVSYSVRVEICRYLGVSAYGNVSQTGYPLSLDAMVRIQLKRGEPYSYDEFESALDPMRHPYGSPEFFQFAILNAGYSGISSSKLEEYVARNCGYAESTYGVKSALRGLGGAFVEASRTYGVNEMYLLSHAIWESAWGCSVLAQGWTPDRDGEVVVGGVSYPYRKGSTYYNFYGIGAVDANALNGGRAMAVKENWTTPRAAVLGAAKWITQNYHNRPAYRQNTLYLMKFDVAGAAATGSAWHEYCTGLDTWAVGISRVMSNGYKLAGFSPTTAPVRFDLPLYS